MPHKSPHFNGPVYQPQQDHTRLLKQHERVLSLMLDGVWRTVAEISTITKDPENSVQAQLRHLRKPRFGAFIVSRRRRNNSNLYEYCVRHRTDADPPYDPPKTNAQLQASVDELSALVVELWPVAGKPTSLWKRVHFALLRAGRRGLQRRKPKAKV